MAIHGSLNLKRAYDSVSANDGYRILVDRLWPRGVSQEHAAIDLWAKKITPTADIRKAFHHEPDKFPDFKKQYLSELEKNPDMSAFIQTVSDRLKKGNVTFVYAAKDPVYNHVVILKEYVEKHLPIK